jgi:hypothetical protein
MPKDQKTFGGLKKRSQNLEKGEKTGFQRIYRNKQAYTGVKKQTTPL